MDRPGNRALGLSRHALPSAVLLLLTGTAIGLHRASETRHDDPVLEQRSLGTDDGAPAAASGDPGEARFFETHCLECHGSERPKAGLSLVQLASGEEGDPELWESVLERVASGEMPPEERPRPAEAELSAAVAWLEAQLDTGDQVPVVRRLTNFEYHNTLRDLLGIELDLTANLPEDPSRPYRFRNNASDLLLGLEQLDRYQENARRAMASVLVDPTPPEIHRKRQSWGADTQRGMPDPTAMQRDELGVFGNRNNTVVNGMRVFEWPSTGAFRIRVRASAILPEGETEVPLRIMLGHDIAGHGAEPLAPAGVVGTLSLTNTVDEPRTFELTGRIENFPSKPEHRYRRGGKIDGRLVITPPHLTVTPVNVFDDGTLNDRPDPLTKPRAVVEWIEFEAPVIDVWPPEHHTRILFASPLREDDPDAYVREVLARFLPRAFRRPVAHEEVERYAEVHAIVARELGLETLEESMRETLALALASPDFLLHVAGAGNPQHETAARLSYFLWGSLPDEELRALADAGRLHDPGTLDAQARRLLDDPRAGAFVEEFTTQWLALDKLPAVPIDLERFPRFLYTVAAGERTGQEVRHRPTVRDAMHAETVGFVGELLRRNASLLELVDADFAMLNQRLAAHYGIEGVRGHALRPVELPEDSPLGGLLTQGAPLVGTSTGAVPHTVYRAVWLREAILGEHVPEPPADVPALEDSVGQEQAAEAVTLKDVLRLHRTQESCRDCHASLDPWGIPLEQFDATGRFRPRVPPMGTRVPRFDLATHGDLEGYEATLDALATVPVEADTRLPGGPVVEGVEELKRYLLAERRDDIAENVVRRLLTYALGRDLNHRDRATVEALLAESSANDHRLRDLVVAICRTELLSGGNPR